MENAIKIHTFENYKNEKNPFDVLHFVDFVYHNTCEDIFNEDERICLITVQYFQEITDIDTIRNFLERNDNNKVIFSHFLESSSLIMKQFKIYNFQKYIDRGQISILISAEFEHPKIKSCNIDCFSDYVCGSTDNINISLRYFDKIFENKNKPYKFLYLNGKDTSHRIDLYHILNSKNLIKDSLFSMTRPINLNFPKTVLPDAYQDYFNDENFYVQLGSKKIFNTYGWPDGLLNPILYTDTYFSIVAETECYNTIHPFITEKTFKVLLMGHPFMIFSSPYFYKHLKNLGYKTFNGLIDEEFDNITDDAARLTYFANSVETLCNGNLEEFLIKSKSICEYNREVFIDHAAKSHLKNYASILNFIKSI